jgi:hypothetical protein
VGGILTTGYFRVKQALRLFQGVKQALRLFQGVKQALRLFQGVKQALRLFQGVYQALRLFQGIIGVNHPLIYIICASPQHDTFLHLITLNDTILLQCIKYTKSTT